MFSCLYATAAVVALLHLRPLYAPREASVKGRIERIFYGK